MATKTKSQTENDVDVDSTPTLPALVDALQGFQTVLADVTAIEAAGQASVLPGGADATRAAARAAAWAPDGMSDDQFDAEARFWTVSFADTLASISRIRNAATHGKLSDPEWLTRATLSASVLLDSIRSRLTNLA